MASDMFIKLEGIKGGSLDDQHKDEIDVLSWSWGSSQPGGAQMASGTGKGKVQVNDLTFTKPNCCASPVLLGAHFSGTPVKKAVLTMRKAGSKPLEYTKITMEDCVITSVNHAAGGDSQDHGESVSLQFARVRYEHTPQKPDGTGGPTITTGYDVASNKPL